MEFWPGRPVPRILEEETLESDGAARRLRGGAEETAPECEPRHGSEEIRGGALLVADGAGRGALQCPKGPMDESNQQDVTRLLHRWNAGDKSALDQLVEVVYPELRRIALRYLSNERPGNTLQSTALVHEAYLRLVGKQDLHWQDRSHFFAVAARIIRGILVDHRRARGAEKRGGGAVRADLEEVRAGPGQEPVDLLDLDRALHELEQLDRQQARIVEMRYFGGLSIEETAHVLGVSPATVKRDWILAKTWIRRRLSGAAPPTDGD